MKILFSFSFCLLFFLKNLSGQVSKVIPIEADDFYNKSMPLLRPQVKNIILYNAKTIKNCKINVDSLNNALKGNNTLKGASNNVIEGMIVLIMIQASKDADADLKNMVLEISHKNEQAKKSNSSKRASDNAGNKNERTAEINGIENLKLQMIIDRKSDMAQVAGYAMKKISGAQQNIINNLK